jgi:hypothetical protein
MLTPASMSNSMTHSLAGAIARGSSTNVGRREFWERVLVSTCSLRE